MKTNDYRNTEYCPILENVASKKEALEKKIIDAHPKQKIIYNKIYPRGTEFHEEFCRIYNVKCAYCGVSMHVLPMQLFEIDHYIAESKNVDKIEAGKAKNLVLSCQQCNRDKKAFTIVGEYAEILNPDEGKIAELFFRDDDYYIKIRNDYINDSTINSFYNQLHLGNQTRRLDYLLLNMQGLYDSMRMNGKGAELAEVILLLQRKRNTYTEE